MATLTPLATFRHSHRQQLPLNQMSQNHTIRHLHDQSTWQRLNGVDPLHISCRGQVGSHIYLPSEWKHRGHRSQPGPRRSAELLVYKPLNQVSGTRVRARGRYRIERETKVSGFFFFFPWPDPVPGGWTMDAMDMAGKDLRRFCIQFYDRWSSLE
jgi:hypothetical protein